MFYFGLIGLALIVIAWVPETIKSLKSKKTARPEFLLLYFLGSLFLTLHAMTIRDLIFIILNAIATVLSGTNLVRSLIGD